MPINQTIARLSDLSFQSAFAVYLLALVLLIWHYAATRTDHVHRFELGSRKLVAAGGVSAPSPEVPGRIVSAPPKPVPERLGNMGAAVLVVGLGLHLVSIVLRGFATGRFPLGNMYEFVTMATAAATATGIVFLRGQTYRAMWVFLLAPVLILMFVAATLLYADAAPVVPALQSYWLPIHVTIVSIGSGVLSRNTATAVLPSSSKIAACRRPSPSSPPLSIA